MKEMITKYEMTSYSEKFSNLHHEIFLEACGERMHVDFGAWKVKQQLKSVPFKDHCKPVKLLAPFNQFQTLVPLQESVIAISQFNNLTISCIKWFVFSPI